MTTNTEATETATELTRAEQAALLGGAGGILAGIAHLTSNTTVAFIACALLAAAAALGMSAGWFVGLTPARPAAARATPAGLVGTRIWFSGSILTVLDDSAVRGGGRRSSVVAADEAGQLGPLFISFDGSGAIAEARIGDGA